MSDADRSEHFNGRYPTPVADLDDHRFQPESLPRANEHHHTRSPYMTGHARHHSRRGTAGSTVLPPPTLHVTDLDPNITARDFETAIADDPGDNYSIREADQQFHDRANSRRDSFTPVVARRSEHRRPRQRDDAPGDRSRTSSQSSRSTSPPNSVDAFAGPLRPRAGTTATLQSLSPSIDPHRIRRQSSQRTFERDAERGRTFSDEAPRAPSPASTDHGSVEDDVCFVDPDDSPNPYTIDFDDLEDFVREQATRQSIDHQRSRQASFSCQGAKGKASNDLLKQNEQSNSLVKENTEGTLGVDSDDQNSVLNEKLAVIMSNKQRKRVNRFNFFSTELDESIHAEDMGDLLMPGESFKGLFELGPEGGCWWMDINMPTEEEVEVLCKAFGIHGLTREDIVQQEPREKVELFRSYYFVCFRSFYHADKDADNYLEPVNVYVVVFREGILTFTFCESAHAANVRKRMGRLRDYVALSSDWICYALIDDIVDTFAPTIRSVEDESETIDDSVFTARPEDSREVLMQISGCRKKSMTLMRLLGGKADVIKGFAKRCNEQYSMAPRQDVGMYLSDIQDHVVTMMSNLGHCEKMLSRSHSNYLAQISADSILQGTQANKILSKVTFIGTVLVPLNLVCGMFGMNVNVPGKNDDGLGWFFGIFGCICAFIVALLLFAKRARLI